MLPIIDKSGHMCLLYSAAILLEIEPEEVKRQIGHDGSEIVFDAVAPHNRRGIHTQEIFDLFEKNGYGVMTIEPRPCISTPKAVTFGVPQIVEVFTAEQASNRFDTYLQNYNGILAGQHHAVAWMDNLVHDPDGSFYSFERIKMQIHYFYALLG